MSYCERHDVAVTTSTGGTATEYTPVINGLVAAVVYASGGASGFASTADFTITTETTGQNIWTQSNVSAGVTKYPVTAAQIAAGTNSSLTEVPVPIANERVKIAIAQGGNTKTGTFTVIVK